MPDAISLPLLDRLRPRQIGRVFGRNASAAGIPPLGLYNIRRPFGGKGVLADAIPPELQTNVRRPAQLAPGDTDDDDAPPTITNFVMFACVAWFGIWLAALMDSVLVHPHHTPAAIPQLFDAPAKVGPVSLALFEDPVAWIVIFVTLATPRFCAAQVKAISNFIPMLLRNYKAMYERPGNPTSLTGDEHFYKHDRMKRCVKRANDQFEWIGRRGISFVIFLAAAATSAGLYRWLTQDGLLGSWRPAGLDAVTWRRAVYDGWWANWHGHRLLALMLIALGCYMFYFLYKQLLMGLVFTLFAQAAERAGLQLVPDVRTNVDGYWGMRPLRQFMLWTYGSSLAHFVITLGVLVIWLPVGGNTILACAVIFLTNITVVIYPSVIAQRIIVKSKVAVIRHARRVSLDANQTTEISDKMWASGNLPFGARNTLTGVTIYLLFPSVLLILGATIK
jgi:hypothetical protein